MFFKNTPDTKYRILLLIDVLFFSSLKNSLKPTVCGPENGRSVHTWAWDFFHGGGSLLHKPKFRKGGQFFWGNFRILLHFYYQIFSENLGWRVCHPGGGLAKGGKAV